MATSPRCRTCGEVDRPTLKGSDQCLTCATGAAVTTLRTPSTPHVCDLAQPVTPGMQNGETWSPVGTIQRCNVCGRLWLAEPPVRVTSGQQSAANRWVSISWRRVRRLMRGIQQ